MIAFNNFLENNILIKTTLLELETISIIKKHSLNIIVKNLNQ